MGTVMSILGIILIGAAIVGAIVGIVFGAACAIEFIKEHASIFYAILKYPLWLFLAFMWTKSVILPDSKTAAWKDALNRYCNEHSMIAALVFLAAAAVIILFFPRKGIVSRACTSKSIHRFASKLSIDFDSSGTGKVNYMPSRELELHDSNVWIYGRKRDVENYASMAIWKGARTDGSENKLLMYNVVGWGIRELPDNAFFRAVYFATLFISPLWIVSLGIWGKGMPTPMLMLQILSLWSVYFAKRVYYSMACAGILGAKFTIFWISIAADVLAVLYALFVTGKLESDYLQSAAVYGVFFAAMCIIFLINFREDRKRSRESKESKEKKEQK